MSYNYNKNLTKIFNRFPIDKLKIYYKDGNLRNLPGIGKKTEEDIKDYFSKNNSIDDRLIEIINKFKSHLYDNPNTENKKKDKLRNKIETYTNITELYDCFKWVTHLDYVGYNKKFKLFIFCFNYININNSKPYSSIENDPMLLESILDIKFKEIDKISIYNSWWNFNNHYRIKNYLLYLFEEYQNDGHVYFTENDFTYFIGEYKYYQKNTFKNTCNIINYRLLELNIKQLIQEDVICRIKINDKYYGWCLEDSYISEKNLSKYVSRMKNNENEISNLKYDLHSFLTNEQHLAINGCLNNKISILSGGPGTGKTSQVLRTICEILVNNDKRVLFLAPTHSAKNRGKSEIIYSNNTIVDENKNIKLNNFGNKLNSYIKFSTLQSVIFKYNHYNPHEMDTVESCNLVNYINNTDYIIIDETSMVTSKDLCELLLNIHNSHCSLLLVGDPDQLPPIGMGCPFIDLINSKAIPNFRLTENFRSKNSDIPLFLNYIKNNTSLRKITTNYKNVHFKFNENYMEELKSILNNFKDNNIKPYDGNDSDNTFQILAPFNNTIYNKGIIQLVREIFYGVKSKDLHVINDIIIMKKNTHYFKNGDYGKIIDINLVDNYSEFTIKLLNDKISKINTIMDENISIIDETTLKIKILNNYINDNQYFKPSYAISVHTSQGLGFNKIITIYDKKGKYGFINKKLNYTAFSRAKDDIYILGEKEYYKNFNDIQRNTLLQLFIENKVSKRKKDKIILTFNNINDSKEIIDDCINKRKKIPKQVRFDVFIKRNDKKWEGKCYVCSKNINITNFHVGHNISVYNGGSDSIDNLEPICPGCNLSMGIENLDYYKNKYYNK